MFPETENHQRHHEDRLLLHKISSSDVEAVEGVQLEYFAAGHRAGKHEVGVLLFHFGESLRACILQIGKESKCWELGP